MICTVHDSHDFHNMNMSGFFRPQRPPPPQQHGYAAAPSFDDEEVVFCSGGRLHGCAGLSLLLFMVILPLEFLLLSQGYTLRPWWFFWLLFAFARVACIGDERDDDDGGEDRPLGIVPDREYRSRDHHRRLQHRQASVAGGDESDRGDIEAAAVLSTDLPVALAVECSVGDDSGLGAAAAAAAREGTTPTHPRETAAASAATTRAAADVRAAEEGDGGEDRSLLPGPLAPSRRLALLQKKGRARPAPRRVSDGGDDPPPARFREEVERAYFRATEVDGGKYKRRGRGGRLLPDDPVDGLYELQCATDEGGDLRSSALVDLRFTRGFCGWRIEGTGVATPVVAEDGDDGMDGRQTQRAYTISKGFLAKSGKIYWEGRDDLPPHHGILVEGTVDDTSLAGKSVATDTADDPGECLFSGRWMSSAAYADDGGDPGLHRGRIVEFRRVDGN